MSDETGYRDDGLDDRIRRAMTGAGAGAAQAVRPVTGADIRRSANRRRQVAAAATLSAALVVGGGAVAASNLLDGSSQGTAVIPGDSSSVTPSPTPEPTRTSPPTTPPKEASTQAPTTSAAPTSPPPGNVPPTEIPAGLLLPHEGETSDDADYSDWKTVEDPATPWDLNVCNVGLYAGDETRTDVRRVSQTGPEWYDSYALGVYADADVAVGVMADMRAAIDGCVDEPSIEGSTMSWERRTTQVGGEAFVAVSTTKDADGNPQLGGAHYAVTRLGSAIFVTMTGGESFPSVDDEQSALLVERLQDFLPTMCVFTVAGC